MWRFNQVVTFLPWLRAIGKRVTNVFGVLIGGAIFLSALGLLFALFVLGMVCLGHFAFWLIAAYAIIAWGYPLITAGKRPKGQTVILGGELPSEEATLELRRWELIDETMRGVALTIILTIVLAGIYRIVTGCAG